jgi:succinate-semialdehyde dehydrogenase/glutarate-semialdehyde dehydrogenase
MDRTTSISAHLLVLATQASRACWDNIERAKALASRIETGAIWINTFASTAPDLPFGGVKRSGYGRELSQLGIKEFVNQKLVLVNNAA